MDIIYKNVLPTDVQNVHKPLKKTEYYDYIGSDGKLYKNQQSEAVLVTAESDLSEIPDIYSPGTIAYTAGWTAAWQLSAAGTWVSMI